MKTEFNHQESLINYLALHSFDSTDNVGLFYGQIGYVITLAQYAHKYNKPQIAVIADYVCDNVFAKAGRIRDISLSKGLSGICWGIEYLVQEKLLDGSADDYCTEVDAEIMKTDITRIHDYSLESGLGGLWHYVRTRIQGNRKANLDMPFDKLYIEKWVTILTTHATVFPKGSAEWLNNSLSGRMEPFKLSLKPFINKSSEVPQNDLSLANGISGFLIKKYL